MTTLSERECVACKGGAPPLSVQEIEHYQNELRNDWSVVEGRRLTKVFQFREFMDAMNWVMKLAELAEKQNHHPNIHVDYSKVTLDLWTHKAGGLTESDFVLAAKIDRLPATPAH